MTAVTIRRPAGDEVASSRAWFPGWRPLATPLLAWALSRLLSIAAIAVGNHLRRGGEHVIDALHLWDGNWFLSAAQGYRYPDVSQPDLGQVNIAFFPLYPWMIRVAQALTGWTQLAAAVLVTALLGALAMVAIWLLLNRLNGRAFADRGVVLLAFFPGTIALTLIYSEGAMLAAAALCLLALLDRRWVLAGLFGALASLARANGIALALACAVAALLAIRERREWRALWAPALAPLGMVGYLVWLWAATGAANVWFRVQSEGWGEGVDFGRSTVRDIGWYLHLGSTLDFLSIPFIIHLRVLGLIVLVACIVFMVRWRPPAIIWAYVIGVLAPSLLSQTLGARPRFIFTAFPVVAAVAWKLREVAFSAVLACSAVLLALATIIYTTPGVVAP
jgi:hypothetical protein